MAVQSKVREELAKRFTEALEMGQLPWQACWSQERQHNAVTGVNYHGINAAWLSYYADSKGWNDPRWCTFMQAKEQGWSVRKGEKATYVEYWAYFDTKQDKLLSWDAVHKLLRDDPDYEKNLQLRCRTYAVFNGAQIDGIPEYTKSQQTDIGEIRAQRDTLIANMGVGYEEHGIQAFYSPARDTVVLPPEATFDDTYSYMATLLHECGHATGHESRLDRPLDGYGANLESYANEELRAEIASAFTAQALGLQLTPAQQEAEIKRHMAYVQSWASHIKDAPEALFKAIKDAEKISDYLIEKGEFQPIIDRAQEIVTDSKEHVIVAIESTDDYTSVDFHKDLVDLNVQNKDGSYGREVDHYRLVTIGENGRITPLDEAVYASEAEAKAEIAKHPNYELVDYDFIVHEAGAQLGAVREEPALTPLQKKSLEIVKKYETLPMQDKIEQIAQSFGATTGMVVTAPKEKWDSTTNVFIQFDNGRSLLIGNPATPEARTKEVQEELVNAAFAKYNPEIINATKELAFPILKEREVIDNAIAAEKGLKPYTLLNVEFNDGTHGFMGWYYVTLVVDGEIRAHSETSLNDDIACGMVNPVPTRENYHIAPMLKESEVDYVFNNVGFSSASTWHSVDLSDAVLQRTIQTISDLEIAVNLDLGGTNIVHFPDSVKVVGNLDLSETPIQSLPDDLHVRGSLDLRESDITTLPKNLTVDDTLNLCNTEIRAIPEDLHVHNLDLESTPIRELPDGLSIGGYLDLSDTLIQKLPQDLSVGGDIYLRGSDIQLLPDNFTVHGNLDLRESSITELPENLLVKGTLELNDTDILQIPESLRVGGMLVIRDTDITNVPVEVCLSDQLYASFQRHIFPHDDAFYLCDDTTYLHIQLTDNGWDYTLYDKETKKLIDGGVISPEAIEKSPVQTLAGAIRAEVFAVQGMSPEKVSYVSTEIARELQEAQLPHMSRNARLQELIATARKNAPQQDVTPKIRTKSAELEL